MTRPLAGRLFFVFCLGWGAAALARSDESRQVKPAQPRGVSVGPALIAGQPVYRGTGHANRLVVPFLGYEAESLYLRGLRAGYRVATAGRLSLDLIAQPRLDQLDPDESEALTGMSLRRRTLEGGASGGYRLNGWRLSATLLTDVLNRHQGQEADIDLSYRIGPPFAFVRPQLSATWQSAALTDYYYGVRAAEARAGPPTRQARR